jgi:hypothetical protein
MENDVFPVPEVKQQLAQMVRVQLYTDGRDAGSQRNQKYQEDTFNDVSLPLYAVLTPDGKPVGHIAGLQSPANFARFLREGREKAFAAARPEATTTASVN